jgi:hypothetical protein
VTKPTVPDVLPLVNAVYARHCAGCCLHILTDDGNVDNDHAAFCLTSAQERGHADCLAAAEMLVQMSRTQRRKVYRTHGTPTRVSEAQ